MPRVRPPRRDELEALRSLERDAARAFDAIRMPEIAEDEPLAMTELEAFRARERAWVAVDERDRPVAYIVEPAGQGPELAALVAHEAATIPGDAPRVAMRRRLGTAPGGSSGRRAPPR